MKLLMVLWRLSTKMLKLVWFPFLFNTASGQLTSQLMDATHYESEMVYINLHQCMDAAYPLCDIHDKRYM